MMLPPKNILYPLPLIPFLHFLTSGFAILLTSDLVMLLTSELVIDVRSGAIGK